jgi:hypothetical protein
MARGTNKTLFFQKRQRRIHTSSVVGREKETGKVVSTIIFDDSNDMSDNLRASSY